MASDRPTPNRPGATRRDLDQDLARDPRFIREGTHAADRPLRRAVPALIILVVTALVLGVLTVPDWLATLLVALSAVTALGTIWSAARQFRVDPDTGLAGSSYALMTTLGFTLVTMVLVGIVLNAVGIPLVRATWAAALALAAGVAVVVSVTRGNGSGHVTNDEPAKRSETSRLLPWLVGALVISGAAVTLSAVSKPRENASLEMALATPRSARTHQTVVPVLVRSEQAERNLELVVTRPGGGVIGKTQVFSLTPGETAIIRPTVPASGRVLITLRNPRQPAALRTLILDR